MTNAERQARWREKHGVKRLRERIAELENENAKLKKELGRPRETLPALVSPRVKGGPDHLLYIGVKYDGGPGAAVIKGRGYVFEITERAKLDFAHF